MKAKVTFFLNNFITYFCDKSLILTCDVTNLRSMPFSIYGIPCFLQQNQLLVKDYQLLQIGNCLNFYTGSTGPFEGWKTRDGLFCIRKKQVSLPTPNRPIALN